MTITGEQLVKQALKYLGMPYVYGMRGGVLTEEKYQELQRMYGKAYVWNSDRAKVGKICCDCSGLIYLIIKVLGGGSYNYSSSKFYEISKKYPIKDIKNAPIGACLWLPGHIGIYVGRGYYVAEDGSYYNCRKASLKHQNWTHYLLLPFVEYKESQVIVQPASSSIDQEQLAKAVSKLIRSGAPIDYNSWKREELMNLKYAEQLVFKVTNGTYKTSFKTYKECVEYLIEKGIITSSRAWLDQSALKKTAFVSILLIKIAASIP